MALVAKRIGRAVTGFYNKVMNFRALDPRDAREGLTASSEVDGAVWDRFYDSQSQEIRGGELKAEFSAAVARRKRSQPRDGLRRGPCCGFHRAGTGLH